jgi:ATPase subunit of ABC transporter with duplicated ATPase domains
VSLRLTNVTKRYGDNLILDCVDVEIHSGESVALLGRNGCGKTTVLKLIAGLELADTGTVSRIGRFSLLQQFGEPCMGSVLEQIMPQAFQRAKRNLLVAEQALEKSSDEALMDFAEAESHFRNIGGYEIETRAKIILAGLGIEEKQKSTNLSGGQERRVLLAKLLIEPADYFLLDEPTNHLDLETIEWLEGWIKQSNAGFLIVSHDRAFLNATVQRCYEIEHGKIHTYFGNYSVAMYEKQTRRETQMIQFENHQRKIEALEVEAQNAKQRAGSKFDAKSMRDNNKIARKRRHSNGVKTAAKRVHAIESRIEHLGSVEQPTTDHFITRIKANFTLHSPNEVFRLSNVQIRLGNKVILENVNGYILRGDRVALIGPNGGGKSTLISSILQRIELTEGSIQHGIGLSPYWAGQNTEELDKFETLYDALFDANLQINKQTTYALLASLNLPKDPFRHVSSLSGGQRTRLSLGRLSITKSNVLLLDEPTNNLDIDAIEALEKLLKHYQGTILFASHDRDFTSKIATRRWLVKDQCVREI